MSYVLDVSMFRGFIEEASFDVAPDTQSISVGDTIDVDISVTTNGRPAGASSSYALTYISLYVGARVDGYLDTHASKRRRPVRISEDAAAGFPVSTQFYHSSGAVSTTIQQTVTIVVNEAIYAGLKESDDDVPIDIGLYGYYEYNYPTGDGVVNYKTHAMPSCLTGLTIPLSQYTNKPRLLQMVYEDTAASDPLTTYGNYVQGKSTVKLSAPLSNITPDYSTAPVTIKSLIYGKLTVNNPDGDTVYDDEIVLYAEYFDLSEGATVSGTYTWSLWIEDPSGCLGLTTGTYIVLPYSPPSLSFSVTRYSEIIGEVTTYEESDDGENVWLDYEAVVSQLNGNNACSLNLSYSPNDNGGSLPITLFSSNDGGIFTPPHGPHDRLLVTGVFSSSNNYVFTATLVDQFGTYIVTANIYKADAYFDIEKTGVAVGMRSTGDENEYDPQTGDLVTVNKKFEVASDYTSHFYGESSFEGGIVGVTTYPLLASGATATDEELTGGKWIDGKPIYWIVMKRTLTLAANTAFGTMPAYETIVSCRCLVNFGTNTKPIPFCYYNNDNWELNWTIQDDGDIVIQAGSSHRISGTVYFIIEYTKPTG